MSGVDGSTEHEVVGRREEGGELVEAEDAPTAPSDARGDLSRRQPTTCMPKPALAALAMVEPMSPSPSTPSVSDGSRR